MADLRRNTSNVSKSIKQLAVLSGWFEQEQENSPRYSLHLNASFREERLGGVDHSSIHFKVQLRRCEIVVILPESGNGFSVDQRTLAMSPPGQKVRVTMTNEQSSSSEVSLEGGVDKTKGNFHLFGRGSKKKSSRSATEHERLLDPIQWQHSRTGDGDQCWIVTSPLNHLQGSLWDAQNEPRFTMVDKRDEDTRTKERVRSLPPLATVHLRCKREDLKIFDLEFKDLKRDKIAQNRENEAVRRRAAEAFLGTEIQLQGLSVGDLNDKFSDMTLAEYLVPLFE